MGSKVFYSHAQKKSAGEGWRWGPPGGGVRGWPVDPQLLPPSLAAQGPKHDFAIQAGGGAGLAQALPLGSVESAKHAVGPRKHV